MSWKRNPTGQFRSLDFDKPFFRSAMIAYVLGLGTTMVVMHFFKAAQPALLYLSPACILSALITAAARGEIKDLFEYTTEEEKEEDDDEKKKAKKAANRASKAIEEITIEKKEQKEEEATEGSIELEEIELEAEDEEVETTATNKKNSARKRQNKK
jgi:minor histocompatibility antigen H13